MKIKYGLKELVREMRELGTSKEEAILSVREAHSFLGIIFGEYEALCARVRGSYLETTRIFDGIQRTAESKSFRAGSFVFSPRI